jgi:fructose-1,6-bisphosphatase I
LDPLDGSSVIDSNTPIGTIFSIYHKSSNLLQPGNKQVGAGYIIYGPSVMFIYTAGNGVNGFTLDPAIGSFILSHPNMRIPEYKDIYSINEGNSELYFDNLKAYLHTIKTKEKPFKLRYVGSMIGDVHRTLIKGGIYLYPEDKKSADGKLRLMLEVNPMSMVIQQAGGMAVSKTIDPLSIKPNSLTQRAPIILGSKKNVEEYLSFVK